MEKPAVVKYSLKNKHAIHTTKLMFWQKYRFIKQEGWGKQLRLYTTFNFNKGDSIKLSNCWQPILWRSHVEARLTAGSTSSGTSSALLVIRACLLARPVSPYSWLMMTVRSEAEEFYNIQNNMTVCEPKVLVKSYDTNRERLRVNILTMFYTLFKLDKFFNPFYF